MWTCLSEFWQCEMEISTVEHVLSEYARLSSWRLRTLGHSGSERENIRRNSKGAIRELMRGMLALRDGVLDAFDTYHNVLLYITE